MTVYSGTLIKELIAVADRVRDNRLSFNDAWREAHSRRCEFEIPRPQDCDADLCGRTIQANEFPYRRFCERHKEYDEA